MTTEQAFEAMFLYLKDYWNRNSAAELADVLGDLQPGKPMQSSDPAAWEDWLKCVETVIRRGRD